MKTMRILKSAVVAASMLAAVAAQEVLADSSFSTNNFGNITNNAGVNIGGQFGLVVNQVAPGQVTFTFTNTIGVASNIAEIYFRDTLVSLGLGNWTISNQNGATFSTGNQLNPGDLPGGGSWWTAAFGVDSDRGRGSDGLNASADFLTLTANYTGNWGDLIAAITQGGIGMHVRSIGTTGQSDAYTTVPLPAAAWLFGSALLGFVGWSRRRKV